MPSGDEEYVASGLAAVRLYARPMVADFDLYGPGRPGTLWYRFTIPPGVKVVKVAAHGYPYLWINGRELEVRVVENSGGSARKHEQAVEYTASAGSSFVESTTAVLRLVPRPGFYGGNRSAGTGSFHLR